MIYRENIDEAAEELQHFKDSLRENLLQYTRQAFQVLQKKSKPRILDIGCGSGVPTLELAKLSGGEVIGIDIDKAQLERLKIRIEKAGLQHRVKTFNRSMLNLEFSDNFFDIIWAEGSIAVIGFEKGLREWGRTLKTGGYLVVHDDMGNLEEKTILIPRCGYTLIHHFILGSDEWWKNYYAPLEKKINEIKEQYVSSKGIEELLGGDQREIDGFGKNPERYRSVFFILSKL
jgi:ubiquinone/menaquinone biosynthesis C-methylase UbiE